MPGQLSLVARAVAAVAVLLVPAAAGAATPVHGSTEGSHPNPSALHAAPCAKMPVEVVAGPESAKLSLARCDAEPSAAAIDELSILSRPAAVARPSEPIDVLVKKHGPELAPGVRRLDGRLVDRLRRVVDHFAKDGDTTRLDIVSGFRPRGSGSFHSSGRALDFRIEGVKNEALVSFCKTLPDTGCGFYPNNVFVHMDVRDEGVGHVAWVDTAGPTDAPREAAHAAAAPAPVAQIDTAVVTPAPDTRATPPAALGLSLAVPVAAAPVAVAPAAIVPAPVVVAPVPELPTLPKTESAHSARSEKVSRAHHGRKTRERHHTI
jgi:hypothetical protein